VGGLAIAALVCCWRHRLNNPVKRMLSLRRIIWMGVTLSFDDRLSGLSPPAAGVTLMLALHLFSGELLLCSLLPQALSHLLCSFRAGTTSTIFGVRIAFMSMIMARQRG